MPKQPQNEESGVDRELELRRRLERDRLMRQMAEEAADEYPGPGAAGDGGKGGGKESGGKIPSNPAATMQGMMKRIQMRAKFWYVFYYVLPLFAIIGLKLKDDDWLKKKAQEMKKAGGGGGDGGSGCAGYAISKLDSCLMVEWGCVLGSCGVVMFLIFALVALLAVLGCAMVTAGGLLEKFGVSC